MMPKEGLEGIEQDRPAHQVVVGLIRRDDELLLLRQQDPASKSSRSVRWPMSCSSTIANLSRSMSTGGPGPGYKSTAFVFEIPEWRGELSPDDPDGYVLEARFFQASEAVLSRHLPISEYPMELGEQPQPERHEYMTQMLLGDRVTSPKDVG